MYMDLYSKHVMLNPLFVFDALLLSEVVVYCVTCLILGPDLVSDKPNKVEIMAVKHFFV